VDLVFGTEDLSQDDVCAVLVTHLAFAREVTPPDDVHALDFSGLKDPAVTLFSARDAGALRALGAIKMLGEGHAELKSMHTVEGVRGQGIGKAMVEHLLSIARVRRCTRVSLETGAMEAFAPARALYAKTGFVPCGPFGEYVASSYSVYMTLSLGETALASRSVESVSEPSQLADTGDCDSPETR
jgi:putative acetyltransferase